MRRVRNSCAEKQLFRNAAAPAPPSALIFSSSCGLTEAWAIGVSAFRDLSKRSDMVSTAEMSPL